ncbi:MAG: hypothetical protein ACRDTE_32975 [Pseudonocardiaceae bacterium]
MQSEHLEMEMTDTCTVAPARTFARRGVEVGRRGVAVDLVDVRPFGEHSVDTPYACGVEVGFRGVEVG